MTESPIELTVIIPAYREADSLRMLLPQLTAAVQALTPAYEILIIDTQERMDDSDEVCAAWDAYDVRHLHRRGGNYYGDAIRTGIAEARGKYVLCMDADGSHNPTYMASMWAKREIWDIVIGSRYAEGGHTENPAILIWMSYVVNLTFRLVFKLTARDVTNSLRLYRTEILKPMHLESNAFDILEEILIRAVTHQPPARIGEVPVTFERRKAGESKRKLVQFAFGYFNTLRTLRKFQREEQRAAQRARMDERKRNP
jgi:dolichol-phosphate mannosyltransferase